MTNPESASALVLPILTKAATEADVPIPDEHMAHWVVATNLAVEIDGLLWADATDPVADLEMLEGLVVDRLGKGDQRQVLAAQLAENVYTQKRTPHAEALGELAVAEGTYFGRLHWVPLPRSGVDLLNTAALNVWLADAFGHAHALRTAASLDQRSQNGLIRVEPTPDNQAIVTARAEGSMPDSLWREGQDLARQLARAWARV